MSIRFMLGVVVGAAGGYAAGRVLEARAHGVPLDLAFKNLTTSVMDLKRQIESRAQSVGEKWDTLRRPQLLAPSQQVSADSN